MKSWIKLEEWTANFLGWKRLKKEHYGQSQHDIEGDNLKGDCKHFKAHRIHSIKNKADQLYKDDVIIFTKVKGTHYEPCNVLVTMNLKQFFTLLKCKRITKKVIKPEVGSKLTIYLKDLDYKIGVIKVSANDMKKVVRKVKEMEEK